MPATNPPPKNPLGDPRAFRGFSTKLKQLAQEEKRSDFLPPIERSIGTFVVELLKIVVIAFVIIIPVRLFVLQPFYVRGESMVPNFQNNDYLIIDELSYHFHQPRRGDVIVLKNPNLPSEFLIKRVIGLPGERVVVSDGKVSIYNPKTNVGGVLNEDSFLPKDLATFGSIDVTLGSNEYYVMGDNRPYSLDSRSFGPVTRQEIIGRTMIRAWPVTQLTIFSHVTIPFQSSVTQ